LSKIIVIGSVQHSGTHFIRRAIGGTCAKLTVKNDVRPRDKRKEFQMVHAHFDERTDALHHWASGNKVIIPLRHPAAVAVSWKKRPDHRKRTPTFLDQWKRMDEFDAFFFPLDENNLTSMPFDELEEYLGRSVSRSSKTAGSIGDYKEKKNLQAMRDFLQEDWALVEEALQTHIGWKFYGNDYPVRGL